MTVSSIHVSYSSQIKYDTQGVLLSTSTANLFVSKLNISTITNNTSSISIYFNNNLTHFTITSYENYLINNIYNSLTNQSNQSDSDSDSYSGSGSDSDNHTNNNQGPTV